MDIQKERELIQESFEVVADEMGFCLDQKWGDYENPYENSDTFLAFNLFKKGWQAKSQAVPEKTCSIQGHEIIINETKNELINDYDIAKEDEYLLEALVYRGVCIGKSQAVPEGFVLVPVKDLKYFSNNGESYEVHDSLDEAKREAKCAIEHYEEMLADQQLDPACDGNFGQIGYGIILAESGYSIDHIVTQDDVNNGDYSYEAGTQIMSLHLNEVEIKVQEQSHD